MSFRGQVLGLAYMMSALSTSMEDKAKNKCKALRKEYANLQNLPRKLKKKEKKRLLFEYSLWSYDLLNNKKYDWA